jgi:hypothetical protein
VVAVEHRYSFCVCDEKLGDLLANNKKYVEWRRLVVFPFEANDVLQFALLDAPAADVDGDVFILMRVLEQLSD